VLVRLRDDVAKLAVDRVRARRAVLPAHDLLDAHRLLGSARTPALDDDRRLAGVVDGRQEDEAMLPLDLDHRDSRGRQLS
jgi:hypothetical protein